MTARPLLDASGRPAFGTWGGEIRDLSLASWKGSLPGCLAALRAKRWRFTGIYGRDVVIGAAVVDAGYLGTAFAYVFDLRTGRMSEFRGQSVLARASRISDDAWAGEAAFRQGGTEVCQAWNASTASLRVDVPCPSGRLRVDVTLDLGPERTGPHQIVTPTPGGSFAFTHKEAGNTARGRVESPACTADLADGETFGAIDHSAGYHDHHWQWRWASLGGRSSDGRRIGLNLVDPAPDASVSENALWIDGRRFPLGPASFAHGPVLEPWRIGTTDNAIALEFVPAGERTETVDMLLLSSVFHQPVGRYSGRIRPPEGETVELAGIAGVAEDHVAKW